MNAWLKHPWRVTGRLFWLSFEFLMAAFSYAAWCAFRPPEFSSTARARWLQTSSRRLLRVFQIEIQFTGDIPSSGLLVCNHLSYLDILVISALTPCVFVAKRDVKNWPVIGWFATLAGTVFVDREQRAQTSRTVNEIEAALHTGAVVVLFPEGTSSGGETILPFKSSLLEPATRPTHALTAGLVNYELRDGDVSEDICYWKDMTLMPHLVKLCSKRGVQAFVQFNPLPKAIGNRKQLARQLHAEVMRMKHAVAF